MKEQGLKDRIKRLVPDVYKDFNKSEEAAVEYDELTKFPELKKIIVDLLTADFDSFLASIDWVAPRPSTFRINLKNDKAFYLIYNDYSWEAEVEGKRYYLLSLPEEERGAQAIARILRYGTKDEPVGEGGPNDDEDISFDDAGGGEEDATEEPV